MNIKIDKKDDIVLKLLHYFITEEDYKPVIINGLENEIWLENMEKDLKLIRINNNYIHNDEQLKNDTYKVKVIMKSIKKSTLSLHMNILNLLLDASEYVNVKGAKDIETIKIDKLRDIKKNKVVKEFFPKIKDAELSDKTDPIEFFKLTSDMNQKTMKNERKLAKIFSQKKPTLTYLFIVINIMVYLFMLLYDKTGELAYKLANNYVLVRNGEYYRIFTSAFLHTNFLHLFFNMYALYMIGPQVERYYGKFKYFIIYFASAILGGLFSCVFMENNVYSLGASGAIFGLLGSVAYFTYYYRATLQGLRNSPVIPVILANLLLGFFIPNVDVFAHIGGLIAGLLISMAIGIGDKARKNDTINGVIVITLIYLFMLYMLLNK